MATKVAKIKGCPDCIQSCQSFLGTHRRLQGDLFQPIRTSYEFLSGQNMAFRRNGRKGFYCIQEGYVRLNYKGTSTMRTVRISGPGNIVGLINCITDDYTLTALEPVKACYFDLEIFFMLQAKTEDLSTHIIKWLCELLMVRDDLISALEQKTAKGRVAALLLNLAKKFSHKKSDNKFEILPRLDRVTLSELSGTAPETTSRILSDLARQNVISRKGRTIEIVDYSTLRDISQMDA